MPHKFKVGAVVNYRPKDRMLSTARGTYMITGLMPAMEGQRPEYRIKHFSEEFERVGLSASHLAVGVDEGLLIDAPNTLEVADIERVLGAAIAGMLAFKLAMGLLLSLGLFQRDHLSFGQHQALLGALGFERFEPFLHGFQVVAQPHATHAGR